MSLTIELSEEFEAALAAQARAAHMSPERYLSEIVESALRSQRRQAVDRLAQQLDRMAALIEPGTTSDEMETALEAALAAARPTRTWRL